MAYPKVIAGARYLAAAVLLAGGWVIGSGGGMLASGYEFAPHPWLGLMASFAGTLMAVLSYQLVSHLRWEALFRLGVHVFLSIAGLLYLVATLSLWVPLFRGLTAWEEPVSLAQEVDVITMCLVTWVCLGWVYGRAGLGRRAKPRT